MDLHKREMTMYGLGSGPLSYTDNWIRKNFPDLSEKDFALGKLLGKRAALACTWIEFVIPMAVERIKKAPVSMVERGRMLSTLRIGWALGMALCLRPNEDNAMKFYRWIDENLGG